MSILAIVGLVIVAAVAIVAVLASRKPPGFRVERSLVIAATPERLQPMVADLHRFNEWNPYRRKELTLKETYGATTIGPGASYGWDGEKVGAGRMTVATVAPDRITMRLEFFRPFEATNAAEFTFRPEGSGTRVTWAMSGKSNFVSKVMQVCMDFDGMIGRDFADGLANLRTIVEGR